MGAFKKPKYEETAADKAIREDIENRRKEELEKKEKQKVWLVCDHYSQELVVEDFIKKENKNNGQ